MNAIPSMCKEAGKAYEHAEEVNQENTETAMTWDTANLSWCDFCEHGERSIFCPDVAYRIVATMDLYKGLI